MEDQKIVELFFSRSEYAISETDLKYGRYCKYISQNILCNREDAEECVNDAYLDAWRAIPPHAPQNLKAFLGKLTRNLAIKALEKKQAEKRGGGQAELALAAVFLYLRANINFFHQVSSLSPSLSAGAMISCLKQYTQSCLSQTL